MYNNFYLIEIILGIYILYRAKKILCNSVCRNVASIMSLFVAGAGSSLVLLLSKTFIPYIFDNVFLQLVIPIGMAILVFFLISVTITRTCLPVLENTIGTMTCRSSRVLAKGVNTLLLIGFLVYMFVFLGILGWLLSLSPQHDQKVRKSFLLHAFFPPLSQKRAEEQTMVPDSENFQGKSGLKIIREQNGTTLSFMGRQEALLDVIKEQRKILRKVRHGFRKTTGFLAEKTGVKTIWEQMQLVEQLFQLSEAEKVWLVHTTPALRKLANNPSVIAVIEDEKLLALIEEVSQGSLTALYQLGEEPLIQKLFDDKELAETIRHIQLEELLQNVKNCPRLTPDLMVSRQELP